MCGHVGRGKRERDTGVMRDSKYVKSLFVFSAEVKINIEEGVCFSQGICNGMSYLHGLDPLICGFDLNPHCIFVISSSSISYISGILLPSVPSLLSHLFLSSPSLLSFFPFFPSFSLSPLFPSLSFSLSLHIFFFSPSLLSLPDPALFMHYLHLVD